MRRQVLEPTLQARLVIRLSTSRDTLTNDEHAQLTTILGRSPTLSTTSRHVRDFAVMLTGRHGVTRQRDERRGRPSPPAAIAAASSGAAAAG